MMKLYAFGYDVRSTQSSSTPESDPFTPTPILCAPTIRILYSSWCDLLVAHHSPSTSWTLTYHGTSLTRAQISSITSSSAIKSALTRDGPISFFGSTMHDGLRGYILSSPSHIVLFSTDLEIETGSAAIEHFCAFDDARIGGVEVDSRGGVYVCTNGGVTYFDTIHKLHDLASAAAAASAPDQNCGTFSPKQICTNATTAMALGSDGKVYTATRDARYAKCLGRMYTGSAGFEGVPYLEETEVKKISSGGYMSAAVSADGELFLWGQGNPGGGQQLAVLKEEDALDGGREMVETGIIVEDGQDEMVKCMSVFVEGEEASVYDVAVGHGHVLVAAEVPVEGGSTRRAVLGAGTNGKGQLELSSKAEFVHDFEELPAFRGLKIEQMAATAWSTFVVTLED
jgi:hypothetical protein